MCGIIGLFAPDGVNTTFEIFGRAMDRMRARGPDDSGVWRDRCIWLGHQRLAIMDTSTAGHQPMISADGRYVMLFNGAIYNHLELRAEMGSEIRWKGSCDTETLLAAFMRWGIDCLSRLNGMFAIAVWDRSTQKLYLARDRMGVKPLYYGWHNGQFVFASRPTAAATLLAKGGREYDWQALHWYLENGFIPGNRSMYRALHKLPPAHYLVCSAGGTQVVRYWDYRHIEPIQTEKSQAELLQEFQYLFDASVHRRLLSDVPLGVFLSSGIDSALVASAMIRTGAAQKKAFTISFPEASFDEAPMARSIAVHLGMEMITESISGSQLLAALPRYLRAVDEPIADSAGIATFVLSSVAKQNITVALTGDGGDELFGGYPHYVRLHKLGPMLKWPGWGRRSLMKALHCFPWHNGKLLAGALGMPNDVTLFHYLRSMSKDYPLLINEDVVSDCSSVELYEQCAASMALDITPVELGARLDMAFTLPDLYLQKLDMATMAHSIEARSPFMDHTLIEWAMRLPAEYKFDGKETKALLKQALCQSLPADWVYRQKRGFSVPIGPWLSGPLREWAADSLRDSVITAALPINWQHVRQLLDWQWQGRRSTYPLVWAVLMLVEFVRNHGDLDADDQSMPVAA